MVTSPKMHVTRETNDV